MATRGRRRKASTSQSKAFESESFEGQESAPTPESGEAIEPETDNPDPEPDAVQEIADEGGDMGEDSDKPQFAVEDGKAVLFALRRCEYSSGGKIVVAEAGEEVKDPAPKDLDDLIEHGCVETFDAGQMKALLSLRDKDKGAKKRLAVAFDLI